MKKFYLIIKNFLCNIPSDKYLHCIVSLALVQLLMFPCSLISKTYFGTIAMLIVMAVGIAKELFDKYVMHTYIDYDDLRADLVGIIFGLVLACAVLSTMYLTVN